MNIYRTCHATTFPSSHNAFLAETECLVVDRFEVIDYTKVRLESREGYPIQSIQFMTDENALSDF